jgi:hypothetical protein
VLVYRERVSYHESIEEELKKCITLCRNCHSEFHYIEKEDYTEIGIHIACPYKLLNEKQDLEDILKRVTTIYLSNNINLIPNIYSEDLIGDLKNYIKDQIIILKLQI